MSYGRNGDADTGLMILLLLYMVARWLVKVVVVGVALLLLVGILSLVGAGGCFLCR